MKSEILYLNESLTENTMTRLKTILLGKDPRIKQFVIGTPENPMGQRLSSKENKIRCDEFESEMNELHIPFIKIVGSYGNKENSYILPNLDTDIAEEILGIMDMTKNHLLLVNLMLMVWISIIGKRMKVIHLINS
jgi:hypothetical protein